MLLLNTFVPSEAASAVSDGLTASTGVRHVMVGSETTESLVHISAHVDTEAADAVIELLSKHDVRPEDVSFLRLPLLGPVMMGRPGSSDTDTQVWAEVIGRAWGNARLGAVDLIFMMTAGVIAGVGVLTGSSILVVGAMAISPDLLPITASAVGIVQREWGLATRALRTLAFGLSISALAACASVLVLRLGGRVDEDLVLAETVLGPSLTTLGPGTILVAVAAGVAAILAYQRIGGIAVGVAISVTTIPAAAYVGDALALGRSSPASGALLVLVTNVVTIVAAATITLRIQRRHRGRSQA